jgi:hypothetical protein
MVAGSGTAGRRPIRKKTRARLLLAPLLPVGGIFSGSASACRRFRVDVPKQAEHLNGGGLSY